MFPFFNPTVYHYNFDRNLPPIKSARNSHKAAYPKSKGDSLPTNYGQFHKVHGRESAGINAFERKYGGDKKVKL